MKTLTKIIIFSSAMSLLTGCSLFGKKGKKEEPIVEITYEEFKEVVLYAIEYEKENLVECNIGTMKMARYDDGFVHMYIQGQNYEYWIKCNSNYRSNVTYNSNDGYDYFYDQDLSDLNTDPYVYLFGTGQYGYFPAALAAAESGIEDPYDHEREYTNIYRQGNKYHIQYQLKMYYDETSYTMKDIETTLTLADNGSIDTLKHTLYGAINPKYGIRSSAPQDIIDKFNNR